MIRKGSIKRFAPRAAASVATLGLVGRHVRQQFVGYFALFIALGGVSYAAHTLPTNSVGSLQIKRGAVKNSDLGKSAVTTGKVKDGSLLSIDFKPGQLVAGAPGATGPQGPQGLKGSEGPRGPSDAYYKFDNSSVASKFTTLVLPAGKYTIAAKASAYNSGSAVNTSANCTLNTGDGNSEHADSSSLTVGAFAETPVTLETVADYPSGGTVTLSCAGAIQFFGRMRIVATQVAALH